MAKLIHYFHKTIITLFCLALIVIMMASASHFINRQQSELSESLQTITHQLIRQSAYSLGPLISRYNTDDDNSRQITSVLTHLAQQPWIIDIAVYQLNGSLIAQAGENVGVRERLGLDQSDSTGKNTVQLVEKIDLMESPVGFIRLTLDPTALQLNENGADYTTKMIWFILILSVSTGVILALALRKWRDGENQNEISGKVLALPKPVVEPPENAERSDGDIK